MSKARRNALRILKLVDLGAPVQAAMEQCGGNGDERRFVSDLVYGVLRARLRLRLELGRFLPKLEKLPKDLLTILDMGAYALLFQDNAKDYAAVNETVSLAKGKFGRKLANVANAALRRLAEQGAIKEIQEFNPVFWSIPESIAGMWSSAYGQKACQALMRRSFQRPWSCVRINMRRECGGIIYEELSKAGSAQQIGIAGIAFPPGLMPVEAAGKPLFNWMEEGAISWQAAASQVILAKLNLFDAWRNMPVWDACTGVGGKAFALMEQGLDVRLVSDNSLPRLKQLRSDCSRLHLPLPGIFAADARQPPMRNWDGHILVDAPCSGLGVLGRRPDIKYRFQKRDMGQLLALQLSLLRSLAALLKPGKELAYLTCTLNPAENEGQIASLLDSMPNLEIAAQWQTPHEHMWLEGMYGCRLRCK